MWTGRHLCRSISSVRGSISTHVRRHDCIPTYYNSLAHMDDCIPTYNSLAHMIRVYRRGYTEEYYGVVWMCACVCVYMDSFSFHLGWSLSTKVPGRMQENEWVNERTKERNWDWWRSNKVVYIVGGRMFSWWGRGRLRNTGEKEEQQVKTRMMFVWPDDPKLRFQTEKKAIRISKEKVSSIPPSSACMPTEKKTK